MSENANINVAIASINKMPHINTEINATLGVSSFLFNNGDMKNKKNSPLKANTLLAPYKNILSAPFENNGRECSNLNKSITNMNVKAILISARGVIIVFVFIIDFLPIKFATTPINRKTNKKNEIG